MTYDITKTNSTKATIDVDSEQVDNSSLDITLFGRLRLQYGQDMNANILHLLEKFACPEDSSNPGNPDLDIASTIGDTEKKLLSTPTEGQLWFNTTQLIMFIFDGTQWIAMGQAGDIAVARGTVLDGAIVPLPTSSNGYVFSRSECAWIVSPHTYPDTIDHLICESDANGLVTIKYSYECDTTMVSGVANYMVVGIRGNINLGGKIPLPSPLPDFCTPTPTPPPSPTPTPAAPDTLTVSLSTYSIAANDDCCIGGSGNTQIVTSGITVSASGGSGVYSYSWTRTGGDSNVYVTPSGNTATFKGTVSCSSSRTATFTCTVNDGVGTAVSDPITVTLNYNDTMDCGSDLGVLEIADISDVRNDCCEGDAVVEFSETLTVNAHGGSAPYTYDWDVVTRTPNMIVGSGLNQTYTVSADLACGESASGQFECTVTDDLGATVTTNLVTVTFQNNESGDCVLDPIVIDGPTSATKVSTEECCVDGTSVPLTTSAVTLSASGGDGGPYAYTWSQHSGDAITVTPSGSPSGSSATFSAEVFCNEPVEGTVKCVVSDQSGTSATHYVVVTLTPADECVEDMVIQFNGVSGFSACSTDGSYSIKNGNGGIVCSGANSLSTCSPPNRATYGGVFNFSTTGGTPPYTWSIGAVSGCGDDLTASTTYTPDPSFPTGYGANKSSFGVVFAADGMDGVNLFSCSVEIIVEDSLGVQVTKILANNFTFGNSGV